MQSDLYENIAPYYDTLHDWLDEDVELVLSLVAGSGPVLDLGCGTGRLLLPLARAGHVVTGVDRSLVMLQRAKQRIQDEVHRNEGSKVEQRISLLCADMTDFALAGEPFELAIISYNTLMHLDAAGVVQACRNIRRHLAPGGRLFIDIVNPLLLEKTPGDHLLTLDRTFIDPHSGDLVVVMAANELDESRQLLSITWIYDASPQGGGAIARRVARVRYYYYFAHQIELALEHADLELIAMYGSYGQDPFTEESERLLFLARRP